MNITEHLSGRLLTELIRPGDNDGADKWPRITMAIGEPPLALKCPRWGPQGVARQTGCERVSGRDRSDQRPDSHDVHDPCQVV